MSPRLRKTNFYNDQGQQDSVVLESPSSRYAFREFCTVAKETGGIILDLDPPKEALRIWFWMVDRLDYGNYIRDITYAQIGRETSRGTRKLDASRVCHMLKLLERAGVLLRLPKQRALMINPLLVYRGKADNHVLVIAEWHALNNPHRSPPLAEILVEPELVPALSSEEAI